jgi:anti-repressor protein
MSVADLSKALRQAGIEMGQNRLFKWFRDNGYMGKRGIHRNRPTQRAIE